ncbi:uncharacterized protein ARMOST_19751 [Armillaria ostoyae]|uniref:Uncharacterized protein n=1 Tax=Armillaria ostoyae TaxID=47428 RepID=A0A284S5F0_ARMOS|nr:uncharacterized protein ARMOST_19751 [Armillaria ostoyae]
MEHNFRLFLQVLEVKDMAEVITNDLVGKYTLPDTVRKTAQDYASAAVLAPNLQAYKAPALAASIMTVMRDLRVQELPPPHETGRCGVLESVISKALTDMRCHVKAQIHCSIDDKDVKQSDDITTLVVACIGTTKAQSTLAVRMHIAFLVGFGVLNVMHYIDGMLVQMRKTFATASLLAGAFKDIYEQDMQQYGSPDSIDNPVVMAKKVESWLTTLDNACGKVLAATEVKSKSSKKSRGNKGNAD